ncbi:hemerythrin domain-containing protein [Dactylosporangium siamense]|uniref:Hemerythrin n=1 Tax=Dactylosporangium siamense TaxID=685454 RepID=A0A919PY42_9ACTN|nr:hemerythrin domain-containing protein [Dactylosporangium siamense]GIG52531.1 hemerythrin [Dactylosporangium siamense]
MTTTQQERDVVDLLVDQHRQITVLFAEVKAARGDAKRDAFRRLVRLLAVHESVEELIVHPAARGGAGDEIVDARLREEHDAKQALSDLDELGVHAASFDGKFAAFEQAVVAHAMHEEMEELPALRSNTDAKQLRRMADALRAVEAIAPTRPHPAAGESATANLLFGPPFAVFDRARDALRDWRTADSETTISA